jgi:hypothetical protein
MKDLHRFFAYPISIEPELPAHAYPLTVIDLIPASSSCGIMRLGSLSACQRYLTS